MRLAALVLAACACPQPIKVTADTQYVHDRISEPCLDASRPPPKCSTTACAADMSLGECEQLHTAQRSDCYKLLDLWVRTYAWPWCAQEMRVP